MTDFLFSSELCLQRCVSVFAQGLLQEPLGEDSAPGGAAVLPDLRSVLHLPDAHAAGCRAPPCGRGHAQHVPVPLPA